MNSSCDHQESMSVHCISPHLHLSAASFQLTQEPHCSSTVPGESADDRLSPTQPLPVDSVQDTAKKEVSINSTHSEKEVSRKDTHPDNATPKSRKRQKQNQKSTQSDPKPLLRLAKKGTLKFREQMRQLVEEKDADQAVDKAALFEDNVSALEPNPFLSIADPNVQSTPRKNSLDVLSLSFVRSKQESET